MLLSFAAFERAVRAAAAGVLALFPAHRPRLAQQVRREGQLRRTQPFPLARGLLPLLPGLGWRLEHEGLSELFAGGPGALASGLGLALLEGVGVLAAAAACRAAPAAPLRDAGDARLLAKH